SDVVVAGNIEELWDTDMNGHAVAAVADHGAGHRCIALQIPEKSYFNAGILVVDLAKWRAEGIKQQIMVYLDTHPRLEFLDQDAMNVLLHNDWKELNPKWNVYSSLMMNKKWPADKLPAIIHYTSASKPWHYDNIHPLKQEYYKYLRLTEWRGYKPKA